MCGIIGTISPKNRLFSDNKQRTDFFWQGLYADTLRGFDSTGMFGVKENANAEYYKRALAAYDFLTLRTTGGLLKKMSEFPICVGHNRAATKGTVIDDNAHPFVHKDVIMVHNGTLTNQYALAGQHDVDSQALAQELHENEANLQAVVSKVKGAYAIAWFNMRTRKFRLLRNDERPMAIAKSREGTWYFGSELDMIKWILGRRGIEVKIEKSYNTKEYQVYEWDLADLSKLKTYKLEKPAAPAPMLPAATNAANRVASAVRNVVRNIYEDRDNLPQLPSQRSKHTNAEATGTDISKFDAQRSSVMDSRLQKVGFAKGELVCVNPLTFTPYDPNKPEGKGSATGYIMDVDYIDVCVPNVKFEDWKEWEEKKEFKLIVTGVTYDAGHIPVLRGAPTLGKDLPQNTDDSGNGFTEEELEEGMVKGPYGQDVTEEEFFRLIGEGCDNCTQPIDIADAKDVVWTNSRKPVCPECAAELQKWGAMGAIWH